MGRVPRPPPSTDRCVCRAGCTEEGYRPWPATAPQREHVEPGKERGIRHIGSREQERGVQTLETPKRVGCAYINDPEKQLVFWKRIGVEEPNPRGHCQEHGYKEPRMEEALHHALVRSSPVSSAGALRRSSRHLR